MRILTYYDRTKEGKLVEQLGTENTSDQQLRLSTRQHLIRKLTRFFTCAIAVICLTRNFSYVH